jgi:PTH1 family peptidyl-tRNA hydrolase
MLIIAGLGNPGSQYAGNRHNIGFMAVDAIAHRHNFSPWRKKFQAEICDGTIDGEKCLLLKPQTYMNESGRSLAEVKKFYKVQNSNIVVIHDELDIPPAKVKMKIGGGHGGHNGLRSCDAHIGKDYRRMRLGIGHPGDKSRVHNHVLGDFAKADQDWLDDLNRAIADNANLLTKGDDSTFMNKVHLATHGKATNSKTTSGKTAIAGVSKAAPKKQSHIRQARNHAQKPKPTGPMADMLKKLLGKD